MMDDIRLLYQIDFSALTIVGYLHVFNFIFQRTDRCHGLNSDTDENKDTVIFLKRFYRHSIIFSFLIKKSTGRFSTFVSIIKD